MIFLQQNTASDSTLTILESLEKAWESFLYQIPGILLGILIVVIGYFIAKQIISCTSPVFI